MDDNCSNVMYSFNTVPKLRRIQCNAEEYTKSIELMGNKESKACGTKNVSFYYDLFARLVLSIFLLRRKLFVFNGYYYYGFSFHRFTIE